jgi:hypothetical protein
VAGRPLRPATRRSLGRPSPHQQADRPRAHPPPKNFPTPTMRQALISGIRPRFQGLSRSEGQVAHVLLTRSPLIHPASWASPFDLHVLSTPPAFVLSQDQTLRKREKHHQTPQQDPTAPSILARPNQKLAQSIQRNPPPHPPQRQARHEVQKYLALTIKHTVEFSNNRRTPSRPEPQGSDPLRGNSPNLPACPLSVKVRFPCLASRAPDGGSGLAGPRQRAHETPSV